MTEVPSSPSTTPDDAAMADGAGKKRGARPLQAALLLAGLYFLSRVVGLIQLAIIGYWLSKGHRDAYTAAFRLPDFIMYLMAGGAMSMTFIPIFTELWDSERKAEAWKFFSTVATLGGCVLSLLIIIAMVWAYPLVIVFNPGLQARPEVLDLTVAMTRVILPAQLLFYLGGIFVGVLNTHKRFGASGSTSTVNTVAAIVVGVLLMGVMGPIAFAWGRFAGAAVGNFVLPLLAAQKGPTEERIRFRPSFDWRNPSLRRFLINALPMMLGISFPVVDQIVVGWFASYLDEGTMYNLNLANRAMLAPLTVLAQAASVAAFPFMASNTAARDWDKFSRFIRSGLCRLMFLALPITTLLILIAQPLIKVLFTYGQFSHNDAQETAMCFAFYCVGLFAWAGQQFVARGFYALQDTATPTIVGSALTVIFFLVSWVAVRLGGAGGLAMATSIGAAAQFSILLLALERRLNSKRYHTSLRLPRLGSTLLRTLVACVVMGLVGALVIVLAGRLPDGRGGDMVRLVVVSAAAAGAFVWAAEQFAIPEWIWLRDKLLARVKR